jgi:hypothetical protein
VWVYLIPEANALAYLVIDKIDRDFRPSSQGGFLNIPFTGGAMEQVLEIMEDRIEADDEQPVVELSTELLSQVGGGTGGITL